MWRTKSISLKTTMKLYWALVHASSVNVWIGVLDTAEGRREKTTGGRNGVVEKEQKRKNQK